MDLCLTHPVIPVGVWPHWQEMQPDGCAHVPAKPWNDVCAVHCGAVLHAATLTVIIPS